MKLSNASNFYFLVMQNYQIIIYHVSFAGGIWQERQKTQTDFAPSASTKVNAAFLRFKGFSERFFIVGETIQTPSKFYDSAGSKAGFIITEGQYNCASMSGFNVFGAYANMITYVSTESSNNVMVLVNTDVNGVAFELHVDATMGGPVFTTPIENIISHECMTTFSPTTADIADQVYFVGDAPLILNRQVSLGGSTCDELTIFDEAYLMDDSVGMPYPLFAPLSD